MYHGSDPEGAGCLAIPALLGHAVGVTGDRRAAELAAYLRAFGANVLHGPMLSTRPITDDDVELRAATAALIANPPDYLLATTGIGIRSWINAAARWGRRAALLKALAGTRIVARGPKVVGAAYEAGLPVWFAEPSGRSAAMVEHLMTQSLAGAHVAIQLPGVPMTDAVARLRGAGAAVTTLAIYDWSWPDDLTAARRLLRAVVERHVSAVTFTSRPAVRNFVDLATREGMLLEVSAALRDNVLPACIGPSTSEELQALTGASPCQPDEALLGMMVQVVAEEVRRRRHRHVHTPGGHDVVVQGRHVQRDAVSVATSEREAAVLRRLMTTPRRTIGRDELLRSVWGDEPVDPSVLETTIGRLRRRLKATGLTILTITGRGYLLGGEIVPCPQPPSNEDGDDDVRHLAEVG